MKSPKTFSWRARGRSFGYAWNGVRLALRGEHNFRIHTIAALLVVAAGCFFELSPNEWIAVVGAIGAVCAAELFNSALEALADRITAEQDPLIGRAKDMAAGAVLLVAIAAAIIGLIVFVPKIVALL